MVLDPPNSHLFAVVALPPGFPNFPNIDSQDFFIDPKLPTFHFMFSGRSWYHVTKIPVMLSGRYWSHIPDFQEFIKRTFIVCRCPSFPPFPNFGKHRTLKSIKRIFKIAQIFLELF